MSWLLAAYLYSTGWFLACMYDKEARGTTSPAYCLCWPVIVTALIIWFLVDLARGRA